MAGSDLFLHWASYAVHTPIQARGDVAPFLGRPADGAAQCQVRWHDAAADRQLGRLRAAHAA